jgi:hypothetical protein
MQLRNNLLIKQLFALVFDSSRKASVSCILLLLSLDLLLIIVYHIVTSPRNIPYTMTLARIRLNLSSINSQENYRFVRDTIYRY